MESVSDRAAGAGLKAAFRYFDGEDIPAGSLTAQAFTVFCVIRPYIDEAKRDFEKSVESGKKGAEKRWGDNSPPIPSHSPPIANDSPTIGCLREAEAEAEADISILTDREGGADKPPKRPRFAPPDVSEVEAYCSERKNGIDPAAFIDYYSARGWKLNGGQTMKDWRSAVRTWERRNKAEQKGGAEDDYWK